TGGGSFGTWASTWDFGTIGTAATTDKKDDKAAKAGKDKDTKDATSEFGNNNPWSTGKASKNNKKTISSGFDFGDFGALDGTNELSFSDNLGTMKTNAAMDTGGWGFTSTNKKDKKKKLKDVVDEKAPEESKAVMPTEPDKVEE